MRPPLLTPASAVAVLTAAVLAAGCGAETPTVESQPDAPSPADLRGRAFVSTAVTAGGGEGAAAAEKGEVRLEFTDDGRIVADAGCNTIGGEVDLADGRLVVPDRAMTLVGCPAPGPQLDTWLDGVLAAEPAWSLRGDRLRVRTGGTTIELIEAEKEEVTPVKALEGTRWTLRTLIDGRTASQPQVPRQATLRLTGGRVEVHSGCNGLGGDARVEGAGVAGAPAPSGEPSGANPEGSDTATSSRPVTSRVTFGPLIGTKMACEPAVMEVENHLSRVLTGQVTAQVDGDLLTLTNDDGLAAQFVAGDADAPTEDRGADGGAQGSTGQGGAAPPADGAQEPAARPDR